MYQYYYLDRPQPVLSVHLLVDIWLVFLSLFSALSRIKLLRMFMYKPWCGRIFLFLLGNVWWCVKYIFNFIKKLSNGFQKWLYLYRNIRYHYYCAFKALDLSQKMASLWSVVYHLFPEFDHLFYICELPFNSLDFFFFSWDVGLFFSIF